MFLGILQEKRESESTFINIILSITNYYYGKSLLLLFSCALKFIYIYLCIYFAIQNES